MRRRSAWQCRRLCRACGSQLALHRPCQARRAHLQRIGVALCVHQTRRWRVAPARESMLFDMHHVIDRIFHCGVCSALRRQTTHKRTYVCMPVA